MAHRHKEMNKLFSYSAILKGWNNYGPKSQILTNCFSSSLIWNQRILLIKMGPKGSVVVMLRKRRKKNLHSFALQGTKITPFRIHFHWVLWNLNTCPQKTQSLGQNARWCRSARLILQTWRLQQCMTPNSIRSTWKSTCREKALTGILEAATKNVFFILVDQRHLWLI